MRLDVEGARRGIERPRRPAARPRRRRGRVGHPPGGDDQHGAGHARRVDRARIRPATARARRLRRLGAGPRLPAGSGARHPARHPAGGGRASRRPSGSWPPRCSFDLSRSYVRRLDALDPGIPGRGSSRRWPARAPRSSARPGVSGTLSVTRSADMRYVGQGYELSVPIPDGPVDGRTAAALRSAFDRVYAPSLRILRSEGGRRARDRRRDRERRRARGAAAANSRLGARDIARGPEAEPPGRTSRRPAATSTARSTTGRGCRWARRSPGPAIVEEPESTTVLPPGARAEVDRWANLIVALGDG